ncbi:hypothetical protein ACMBCN_03495, partial [Candidatus Liberibacter asiaticus]|nr:hypothetical protein [Candidatus Liberibacter asiaticus]
VEPQLEIIFLYRELPHSTTTLNLCYEFGCLINCHPCIHKPLKLKKVHHLAINTKLKEKYNKQKINIITTKIKIKLC